MSLVRILLLVGLCGLVYGQTPIYHLRDDGLYQGPVLVYARSLANSRATMCYTGDTVYLAHGVNSALGGTTTILQIPTDTVTFVAATYAIVPNNVNTAIDCCCQYVVYGYPEDGEYKVRIQHTNIPGIRIDFTIPKEITIASISIDCNTQTVRVVDREDIYTLDITTPGNIPTPIPFGVDFPLVTDPRCVAFASSGGVDYLFASFEDRDIFQLVDLTGSMQARYQIDLADSTLKTGCLTVDGTNVYFFSRNTASSTGYLINAPVATVVAVVAVEVGSNRILDTGFTIEGAEFFLNSVGEFVNGISVCTSCLNAGCLTSSCTACNDPDFPQCGFCSPADDTCLCGNPATLGCTYDDPTTEATCARPTPRLDASCVVLNPLADRRSGGPNGFALVRSPSEAVVVQTTNVQRAAKTGRWPTNLQPLWQPILPTGQILEGYETQVQPRARGRRFGFFNGEFVRDDGIVENIYCIATERSGFTNRVFSYVAVEAGSITLEADLTSPLVSQVRWRYTSLTVPGQIFDIPGSDGLLSLTISPVSKATGEGVYEVYRSGRYLRTWHPIFYLYVRECAFGLWGDCTLTCPLCENGICDVTTGLCRCFPGFTGALCENTCGTSNQIGQDCDIDCDNIFSGIAGTDCINLAICNGDELGCQCRSGLQLPDCISECLPDTWGPNCGNTCDGCVGCDARTGCPP